MRRLDLSDDLFGKVKPNSTFFSTGSTTDGEEWGVYGSNMSDSLGTLLIHGTTESAHAIPDLGMFKYYDFVELSKPSNSGDNFLIADLTTRVAAPEPVTWALMLVGVAGVGATLRRRGLEQRGTVPTPS